MRKVMIVWFLLACGFVLGLVFSDFQTDPAAIGGTIRNATGGKSNGH